MHASLNHCVRLFASILLASLITVPARAEEPLRHILFGSCLDTHEHPMLDRTLTLPCDLFLFMGDNVYGDTGGIPLLQEKYRLLKQSRFFKGLRKVPVMATWDDHDFGQNDGGSDFTHKREAQTEFWNWLDEPADSPRRRQEGVYTTRTFGPPGQRLQVILLDTRYFRSPLRTVPKEQRLLGGPYTASDDPTTTMLGETQWRWLEATLDQPADLRLIVSSIQFAPEVHGGECWANLPHEQQRMRSLLKGQRVAFLSGDRHWSEFSHHGAFDFTSSSMTQKHPRGTPTANRHRIVPTTYHLPNVGHLQIDWDAATLTAQIIREDGDVVLEHRVPFAELVVQ